MANLGKKYSCYSCHTKFYDLGKPEPLCPKCGADQRDAQDAPATPARRTKVVDEPEENDFDPDREDDTEDDSDDAADDTATEEEAEEEEEEEY